MPAGGSRPEAVIPPAVAPAPPDYRRTSLAGCSLAS